MTDEHEMARAITRGEIAAAIGRGRRERSLKFIQTLRDASEWVARSTGFAR